MNVTIRIGDQEVPGQLPLMGDRFRLIGARARSLGYGGDKDDDDVVPALDADPSAHSAVCCAALAVCWKGEPLDLRVPFRALRHDIVEFGEVAFDALYRAGFRDTGELLTAGKALLIEISESIPSDDEVKEAADPTEAQGEGSTAPTS